MCRMPSSLLAKIACSSTTVGFVDSEKEKGSLLIIHEVKTKEITFQSVKEHEDVRYYKKASIVQNLDLSTRQMAIQ